MKPGILQYSELDLDCCTKCNICNSYCPVMRVNDDYPGPKALGPERERDRRAGVNLGDPKSELCLLCKTCDLVCPSGVPVSDMIAAEKERYRSAHRASLRDRLLADSDFLGKAGHLTAPIANPVANLGITKKVLEGLLGIQGQRSLPEFSRQSFSSWIRNRRPGRKGGNSSRNANPSVAYFHGCHVNFYKPELGKKVVAVLEHNGIDVVFPEQVCCGLPFLGAGDPGSALKKAQINTRSLRSEVEAGRYVITSSTSCGLMVRHEYSEALGVEAAAGFKDKVLDVSEYLMMLYSRGQLRTDFRELRLKLAYHMPCHLRILGIGQPGVELLRLIPGVEIEDMDRGCCGLGGTYGFKCEKYADSMEIGRGLFEAISDFGPDYVVSDCEGCRMQMEHGVKGLRAVHPIEVLYAAYGFGPV